MSDNQSGGEVDDLQMIRGYLISKDSGGEARSIDLLELWHDLTRFKLMSAMIMVSVVCISVLAAFLITPVYRSYVLMAPVTQDSQSSLSNILGAQFGSLATLAGMSFGKSQGKDEAIAILRSREFTESFITDLNLLPILFDDEWDPKKQAWRDSDPSRIPTIEDGFEKFDEDVRAVDNDSQTGLVTLTIDWKNRELAAYWANDLVKRLNRYLRTRDIEEAKKSIDYLNQELSKQSSVEVRQGIYSLIEQQIETAMLANVRDEYAFRVLDPAVPSDADNFVWPKRVPIVLAGFALGLVIAFVATVVRNIRVNVTR